MDGLHATLTYGAAGDSVADVAAWLDGCAALGVADDHTLLDGGHCRVTERPDLGWICGADGGTVADVAAWLERVRAADVDEKSTVDDADALCVDIAVHNIEVGDCGDHDATLRVPIVFIGIDERCAHHS